MAKKTKKPKTDNGMENVNFLYEKEKKEILMDEAKTVYGTELSLGDHIRIILNNHLKENGKI